MGLNASSIFLKTQNVSETGCCFRFQARKLLTWWSP